ncbi:C40 family peptidase [Lentzea sp. JNUCC 0626]|uniref:C40 family peptidase n=1 Tax=Lentzea sp. JNUCC 0626 TaxID=3367513 RepID=UPI0037478B1C
MFKSKLTRLVLALAMISGSAGLNLAFAGTATAAPECGALAPGAAQEAQDAVDRACDQLGTPYSWGGGHGRDPGPSYGYCDPANGAPNDCNVKGLDCSGFVRYAYALAVDEDIINGITTTQWQSSRAVDRFMASDGYDPLLPGDLLLYGTSPGNLHHVTMYLGDGWIIEAPFSGGHVRVMPASTHGDYYGAVRLFEGSTSSGPAAGADRIAYTETDGSLYARDGELGAGGGFQEGDVQKYEMNGNRVGVLTNDGALLVKEGDLGPGWHTVNPDSVTDFDLDGDRIAFTEGNDLYVSEGELGSELVKQDASVKSFQLSGDRIGVQTTDDKLLVKEGDLGPGWVEIAAGVSSFQLHGTRIAYTEGNDLWAQEGDLDAPSVFQEHDIRRYQLNGDRLGAQTVSGDLLVKEGDLEPGWVTVDSDVVEFQLEGTRIGYRTDRGHRVLALWVQEGDLDAPSELLLDQQAFAFQLDGERIAVQQNQNESASLLVKEGGLDAEWVSINPDSVRDFQIGADRSSVQTVS